MHNPETKPWIEPTIHIDKYFEEFKELLIESRVSGVKYGDFREASLDKVKDMCEDGENGIIPENVFYEIVGNCDPGNFK